MKHIQNLSSFKNALFSTVVSFLINPYSTVKDRRCTISKVDDLKIEEAL